MGRRSSGGRSASRPAARSSSRSVSKPAASASPPPAPVEGKKGSVFGNIASAVTEGLSFGTGNALGHRAVEAVFGPRVIQHEVVAPSVPADAAPAQMISSGTPAVCGGQSKALFECLESFATDISKCQFYMDMFQECRRGSGSGASLAA